LEEIYHFEGGNPIQARLEKPPVLLRRSECPDSVNDQFLFCGRASSGMA
jgi:hypothetical protein